MNIKRSSTLDCTFSGGQVRPTTQVRCHAWKQRQLCPCKHSYIPLGGMKLTWFYREMFLGPTNSHTTITARSSTWNKSRYSLSKTEYFKQKFSVLINHPLSLQNSSVLALCLERVINSCLSRVTCMLATDHRYLCCQFSTILQRNKGAILGLSNGLWVEMVC